ncbi:hypothetical protein [Streptomyces sp. NBC_01727]|uniref:hypothetical protein n=1 Tax=Streptomyces sp. NBC_01727 TaxID=2975924 RepID=UPI002E1190FD|nr:hypothetical protein OIE76_43545 [Streptomyces sp. NBC_01727]
MGAMKGHTIGIAGGVSLARADEGAGVKSMPVSENGLSLELLEELAVLAAEKTAAGGLRLMGAISRVGVSGLVSVTACQVGVVSLVGC